jgi:tetratricopeptide (TPR) repeat protein
LKRAITRLLCLPILAIAPVAAAQQTVLGSPHTPGSVPVKNPQNDAYGQNYSSEPYVIEQYTTAIRFNDDGTAERVVTARIHAQTETGVSRLSDLVFDYDSTHEQFNLVSLRIRRPSGASTTPTPSVMNLSTSAVHDAPAYTDFKEARVTVPELHAGDVIEYQVSIRLAHPLAPGNFWAAFRFLDNAVVLHEQLEISVPAGRAVKFKSPHATYSTDAISAKGRVIYRWTHANLTPPAHDETSKNASAQSQERIPDVELTSFVTWDEFSKWYAALDLGRAEATPEIKAKALDLTANSAVETDKIHALYDYVSRNIRTVDLPFSPGAHEMHSAAEVFTNQYGDATDKHTLLSAMLRAAGIPADSVLLSSSRNVDPQFPSPTQFDRLLTTVPRNNEIVWMDETDEVAPFRFLPAPLRGKTALLVSAAPPGKIIVTLPDPPFLSTQDVEMESQVSALGKLTGKIRYRLRGDNEFVLRLGFHRTPQAQWKELAQTILALDGVRGEVVSVKPSDPVDTRSPFALEIDYAQPNFLDWSAKNAKVPVPLLAMGMPDAPKKPEQTIALGSPLNVQARLQIQLPPDFAVRPPVGISVTRDYAEFKSSYALAGRTLTAERSLHFKMRAVPASRAGDYLAFSRAVEADQNQPLFIDNSASDGPAIPQESTSAELFEAGSAALDSGNINSAIPLLERVSQLDPDREGVWNSLGLAYLRERHFDRAADAFQKQLAGDPSDAHAHNYLGIAFEQQQKFDEAADAFRKQIALDPLDTVAHAALGSIYLSQHEYAAAIPELDKATVLLPDKAELQVSLGEAYINTGQSDKALIAFGKAVQMAPAPVIWNDVASSLASHRLEIDKALDYAKSAVNAASGSLRNIDSARVTPAHFAQTAALGAYWDTLGWAYFQKNDLDTAQRYIRSAWLLNQHGDAAGHLAQIYEKHSRKDAAIRTYALALAAARPDPDSRARLILLLGGNSQIDDLVSQGAPNLLRLRTFSAGKLFAGDARADILLVLAPGEKPSTARATSVRFLGGSETLRPFTDKLRSLDYGPMFPDAGPVDLVRHGTLSCSAATSDCSLVLDLPGEIAETDSPKD